MTPEEIEAAILRWRSGRPRWLDVEFREAHSPGRGRGDDYNVSYEAVFEPTALDKARLELWVTDTGYTAVGFESYDRLIQRLKVRCLRRGFVAGHEPRLVGPSAVSGILDAVADGKVQLRFIAKLGLLLRTKAEMSASDLALLEESGYDRADWVCAQQKNVRRLSSWALSAVARYRPW